VLDNGPLRFTVSLSYPSRSIGADSAVVEKRLISLDAGSQLNKVVVSYENLRESRKIATGIVLHRPSEQYFVDEQGGYMGYADPENPKNGQMYIGAIFPRKAETIGVKSGHLLGISTYMPSTEYVYYFGAGWSKWGINTMDDWSLYLKQFTQRLSIPLVVTVE
jgi:Domain of unknown function (DUF4861)